jgi:hypothetical protein
MDSFGDLRRNAVAKASLRKELIALRKRLDLSKVVKKTAENYKWNREQTAYAVEQYIHHWYICINHPGQAIAAISYAGDLLWHQHIIDTQKYATDCQSILGRFLGHLPIYGKPSAQEKAAYEATQALYLEAFGAVPQDLRPLERASCVLGTAS